MAADRWRFRPIGGVLSASAAIFLTLAAVAYWHQSALVTHSVVTNKIPPKHIQIAECLARHPVRIARSVYLLGDMRPSAVYVVDTAAGLAIIDSGLESAHQKLLAGLSRLNLDISRLKMILLTHAHGDHTMGAQRLREETGAAVYIGRDDAAPLRRGAPWEAIFSKFDIEGETAHPTIIDGELADGQVLQLGQAQFTVIATPGHTPGSCCFLLEIDGLRVLFTGDTISTFTTAIGTYSARLPPRYRGDAHSYLRSLERLHDLSAPDLLLPGHPGSDLAAPDPHLAEEDWQSLLERGMRDLRLIDDRYTRDGADFLNGTPKALAEGVYYLGDAEGRASYALVDEGQAVLFDGVRGQDALERLNSCCDTLGVPMPRVSTVVLTSVNSENLSGLYTMVVETGCRVVVPDAGAATVADYCPQGASIIAAEELSAAEWTDIRSVSLGGLGPPEAAYYFRRNGSLVLISGDVPLDLDAIEVGKLQRQPPPEGWNPQLYTVSLARLAEITPDIWLCPKPLRGRNANIYDRGWRNLLLFNQQLVRDREAFAAHQSENKTAP